MKSSVLKKILIIEDNEDILNVLSIFLESEGYAVLTCKNGLEGLNRLQHDGLPDLILLDITLPVMCGFRFVTEFRQKYGQKVPIVLMTAALDAEEKCKEIHASNWIGKPFKLEDLLSMIKGQVR